MVYSDINHLFRRNCELVRVLSLFGMVKLSFVFVANFLNITFENTEIKQNINKFSNKYIEIKY